ncbi:MAG: LacI family DNA-binding transcriptional regulator [Phycisphaeraceae bacterium]
MTFSQKELARISGFSQFTVSRALAGHSHVAEATRSKILRLAERHGYRPSAAARAMRHGQTRQIGVVLHNDAEHPFENPAAFEMVLGINNRLATEDYMVVLVRISDVTESLRTDSRVFQEHALDGIIVSGMAPSDVTDRIRALVPNCVFVDCNVWEPEHCVRRDEQAAGQMAARALIAVGHRRLAWVGPVPEPGRHYSVFQRYEGVQAVAREAGLPLEHYGIYPVGIPSEQAHQSVVRDVRRWWEAGDRDQRSRLYGSLPGTLPGAGVITYNTNLAMRWLAATSEAGLLPCRDYGLVCCDSTYDMSCGFSTLSRALFDRFEMGIQVAEMMLQVLRDPQSQCASRLIPASWYPGGTLANVCPPSERFRGSAPISGDGE